MPFLLPPPLPQLLLPLLCRRMLPTMQSCCAPGPGRAALMRLSATGAAAAVAAAAIQNNAARHAALLCAWARQR